MPEYIDPHSYNKDDYYLTDEKFYNSRPKTKYNLKVRADETIKYNTTSNIPEEQKHEILELKKNIQNIASNIAKTYSYNFLVLVLNKLDRMESIQFFNQWQKNTCINIAEKLERLSKINNNESYNSFFKELFNKTKYM